MMDARKPASVDEYLSAFVPDVQEAMQQVRMTIKQAVPQVIEVISYGMPAFKVNKVLVYFAGYARHIGFYPGAAAINAFKADIERYKWAKGSVQFPLDQPIPLDLIKRITLFRMAEDAETKRAKSS